MYDQMSSDDKTVSPTIATNRALLRQSMRGLDMQVVVASLLGGVNDAAQIPDMVVSAITSSRKLQIVAVGAGIDPAALLDKLNALPLAALRAIQLGVTKFNTMSSTEMFGPNGLPSLATLARLGLIDTRGDAAWGLVVVQLNDWRTYEIVLRRDPATMDIGFLPYSLNDASEGLVKLVRTELDGEAVTKGRSIAFALAGLIALQTGWRNLRIEERNGCAAVEILREELLGDLYRGELYGLALRGINAPKAT